jgi:hypothetical protein
MNQQTDAQESWDAHRRRAFLLAGLWGAFFSGAALAEAVTPRFASWTLFPTVILLALAASAGGQRIAIR